MNAVKLSIAALAIAGLCAGMTSRANAQAGATKATTEVVKPFTVKIGGLFPSNKDAGSSTLSVGIGYDFLKTKSDNPILVQGYVDYFGETSKSHSAEILTLTNKMDYALGVGVAGRYMLMQGTSVKAGFSPYAFAGIGIYTVKGKQDSLVSSTQGSTTTFRVATTSKTRTSAGGKIGLGAELKVGLFGELEYNFLPSVNDVKPSGFGARLGYRF